MEERPVDALTLGAATVAVRLRPAPRLTHELLVRLGPADAAPEPRNAAGRARRRPDAWARLRQPRLPPRHGRQDRAAVPGTAMDRLSPRVQGTAPVAADAARSVHRAVLPRRGDRARGRPSSVRGVPPRGLRGLPRAVDGAPPRAEPADAIDLRLHAERFDSERGARRLHDVALAVVAGRRVRAPARRAVRSCAAPPCSSGRPAATRRVFSDRGARR